MNIIGIIPARYASTRFPGKPLIELKGKTMIERVVEQCKKTKTLSEVLVATDDERIYDHVLSFGGKAMMTDKAHTSGTERCAEVIESLQEKYDYVINIQGDEPLIQPEQIDSLGEYIIRNNSTIATQAREISESEAIESHDVVKVVVDKKGRALYFSRSVIPYERNERLVPVLQHIGIYAFASKALSRIVKFPSSNLELTEGLEQLRWLENGETIDVVKCDYLTIAIDSPEDVEKVIRQL